ncbi:hypothetical protein [Achromobacter sp. 2789STDY5608615]|uniref:hypothetical protein n=1 Tax=Achromobacter sp. 2789STDY5608615 TaxID=1806492 RepID=UPI0006C8549E|nr:hypothetical protein [Achromobacter sp. 2789STDY5608615]
MTEAKKKPDWERIEADYRSGLLSVREIAARQGISHVAIAKRAKRDGWERDLSAQIRAKAEALVTKQAVTTEVSGNRKEQDAVVVKESSEQLASVMLTQRRSVTRAHNLCMALFTELEAHTNEPELFGQLGEFLREEGEDGARKRAAVYEKVLTFGARVDGMKKLGETLKVLVGLERDIYGLNNPEPPPPAAPASAQGMTVVSDDPNAAAAAYRALMN